MSTIAVLARMALHWKLGTMNQRLLLHLISRDIGLDKGELLVGWEHRRPNASITAPSAHRLFVINSRLFFNLLDRHRFGAAALVHLARGCDPFPGKR